MCSLLKIMGANNITQSTRKKIHVGSVIGSGRYEVITSKVKGKVVYFYEIQGSKPLIFCKDTLFLTFSFPFSSEML